MRSSAVVSGPTAAIPAGALLACLHAQFSEHDGSSCVPSVLQVLHTLGVSYPDRYLHAVPASPSFCTSRWDSQSNHVCPPITACKGVCKRAQHYFARNLRHMGQTPPLKRPAIIQDLAV